MITGKKVNKALSGEFLPNRKSYHLTTGEVVKILREKNNLSQNELAKLTGLTQATISSIENNRVTVGIERAKILAIALNVHPAVIAFPDWDSEKLVA